MARGARPSDLYRLPEHAHAEQQASSTSAPEGPRRRFPAWLGVALVLAALLVVSGVLGSTAGPIPGEAPLVDIVSEDQAIAALTLYGAQASTMAELRERRNIYANPGPGDAARVAAVGTAEAQRALDAARKTPNADPLMRAYVDQQDHATAILELQEAQRIADAIALLASTHDTVFGGTGAIPLDEAHKRITSLLSGGLPYPQLDAWGRGLLDIIEERGGRRAAVTGRVDSQRMWAQIVTTLRPAGVVELQTYIDGLPPVTVEGLRGHPVAGPALQQLEQQRRQVSSDAP